MQQLTFFCLFSVIITIGTSSCGKKCNKLVLGYQFELPVTLSPAKETYQIGDTISIVSEFSDMVFERNTGDTYLLENFQFFPIFGLNKIDSLAQPALEDFTIIAGSNTHLEYIIDWGSIFTEYHYENNRYAIEFQIIPQKRGIFVFSVGSTLTLSGRHQDFQKKCYDEDLSAFMVLNGDQDYNIEYLQASPDPFYNELTEEEITEAVSSLFAFQVR